MSKQRLIVSLTLIVVLLLGAFGVSAQDDMMDESAYVRVAHFAIDAPAVDVFVNGAAVLEGVPFPAISDYLEVEGGEYEIAVAPAGEGIDAAVIGPVMLEFAAGHMYTVAATGQLADASFGPVVIDETAAFMGFMSADDMAEDMEPMARVIVLHGISDAPAVDVALDAETVLVAGAAFNQFATLEVPAGEYDLFVTAAGDFETVVFDLTGTTLQANTLTLLAAVGTFPGDFQLFAETTGTLNLAEVAVGAGSFTTLVAALDAAGLVDTIATGGPFTVFAPTDEAFAAALETLGISAEDLLADTETLTSILLYHVVEGEAYAADVVGLDSVTTLQGSAISISADDMGVYLNDTVQVIATDILASNGVIHVIDGVLLPPAE
ncbi:MAG: fasciclin domain-containing protein [Anaerolineae bacterium]|nr:fasciclin domain-containing protein [Anaerolineae bacterium]